MQNHTRLIQILLLLISPMAIAGTGSTAIDLDATPAIQSTPAERMAPATEQIGKYDAVWLQRGVKGQVESIPLIEAVRALVPDVLDIRINSDVDSSAMVRWQSGTITTALREILTQAGAKYRVYQGKLFVESLTVASSAPQQHLAWPRFISPDTEPTSRQASEKPAQTAAARVVQPFAPASPAQGKTVQAAQPEVLGPTAQSDLWWTIKKGEKLSTILVAWGQKVKVKVVWEAIDYESNDTIRIFGTFDSAFNQLIKIVNRESPTIKPADDGATVGRTIHILDDHQEKNT